MPDDRSEMEAARLAGLAKRHEQRLENATYTAAEVKVLTEAALRLGRAEALDEAAAWIEDYHGPDPSPASPIWWEGYTEAQRDCARMVRELPTQPSPDATSGRTDPGMDSDLPQDSQAGRAPQEGPAT